MAEWTAQTAERVEERFHGMTQNERKEEAEERSNRILIRFRDSTQEQKQPIAGRGTGEKCACRFQEGFEESKIREKAKGGEELARGGMMSEVAFQVKA